MKSNSEKLNGLLNEIKGLFDEESLRPQPSFQELALIEGPFEIDIPTKKYVGYDSLKRAAISHECFDFHKTKIKIPAGFVVETDGFLWSIRKKEHCRQG